MHRIRNHNFKKEKKMTGRITSLVLEQWVLEAVSRFNPLIRVVVTTPSGIADQYLMPGGNHHHIGTNMHWIDRDHELHVEELVVMNWITNHLFQCRNSDHNPHSLYIGIYKRDAISESELPFIAISLLIQAN